MTKPVYVISFILRRGLMEPKGLLLEIYDSCLKARQCLEMIQNALLYNSDRPLEMTVKNIETMSRVNGYIAQIIKDEAKTSPETEVYISIPNHLEKIREYTQKIIAALKEKISLEVLFSDRSVNELNFILEKVMELLGNTSDIVLVKNTLVLGYVRESEASVSRTATDYETNHEEKLIEGTATTKASILFIDILVSLKGIAWHARGVAEDVFE
jgi:Na+/phosphate symporter